MESFNGKLRDELLNGEVFHTLKEAKVLIDRWRAHYNGRRPHSSLGYRPPAPETWTDPAPAPRAIDIATLTEDMDRIFGAGHTHSYLVCFTGAILDRHVRSLECKVQTE